MRNPKCRENSKFSTAKKHQQQDEKTLPLMSFLLKGGVK